MELLNEYRPLKKISKNKNLEILKGSLNMKYDLTVNLLVMISFFLQAASIIKEIENFQKIQIFVKMPDWYNKESSNYFLKSDTYSGHDLNTNNQKIENQIFSSIKYFKNIDKIEFVEDFDYNIDYILDLMTFIIQNIIKF